MPPPREDLYTPWLAQRALRSSASQLVVVEWVAAGATRGARQSIAPLHVHHEDDEAWYVLDGALAVRLDDTDVEIQAGGAVMAPRGTRHTYWNPLSSPTRYLLVMTPRIDALIQAIHEAEDHSERAVADIFAAHASTYLGWP